jgi:hypothetical protein
MAQGQSGNTAVADAPDTLPPDFFDKKKGSAAPDTLPADFFENKTASAAKPGSLEEYLSTPHNGTASAEEPSLLHKITHEYPAAALSAAGLPTSLSDVPDWVRKMTGQAKGQPLKLGSPKDIGAPVIQPIKEAAKNPTEENIIGAVPMIGPGSVQAAHKFAEGKPGEGIASLAGTVSPFVGPKVGRAVANKIPDIAESVGSAVKNIPDKTALALRTEEGALKPRVETASRVAGGALGGLVGSVGGVPGEFIGGGIGGALGPTVADRLIPNIPTDIPVKPGATSGVLPSIDEFYANRAEDLAKRGKEQAVIDKAAAREAKANPPFETPGSAPATLPSADEFYERRGMDLLRRGAQEEALAKKQAASEGKIPKIVSPTEGEPRVTGSEGRPATWTNEFVLDQAAKGNRDAISQAVRRGLELPENARYVMGDPDFPRAVLNPREVTLFSPEGIPIRNKANAQAEAQQGNIPTIARTPRGKIPTIGEQPPAAPVTEPTAAPEPIAAQPQGKIPTIGKGKPGTFKVPAMKPIVPPDLEPVLKDSGWSYKGKDASGYHTIEEPGTNIKVRLLDRDLNPEFVRRKIAEKEKQFGGPETHE